MQIIHDAEIADGKHKDLLLASNIKEANEGEIEDIELCSIGFKKTNERESALRRQQHKNIRTNACILNHIGLLVEDPTLPIAYLDFSGRSAYIVQLFRYQDCFVSHKIGDFGMMKSLLELDLFRRYILNLYTWKQCVVNTNNTVLLAHLNQVSQYSMIDVSDDRDIESVSSPKYTVKSIKVILSPSKGSKRKRSVFEK
ncbi:hypothetical protein BDF21DRAFT_413681 [Thamnidium elegans]|nr:hypothetical protein BDF21DRAFT_413681 [Thamnidium elegans]